MEVSSGSSVPFHGRQIPIDDIPMRLRKFVADYTPLSNREILQKIHGGQIQLVSPRKGDNLSLKDFVYSDEQGMILL
jgi:hypothetical protein